MSDNFTIAEYKKENPIYVLLQLFPSFFSAFVPKKLLCFLKRKANGINKCPILGLIFIAGLELFNAIFLLKNHHQYVRNILLLGRMGAMITFMRIMAKYGGKT
jgi:hypothetical protein